MGVLLPEEKGGVQSFFDGASDGGTQWKGIEKKGDGTDGTSPPLPS
jgi:hypothetical protein